MECDLQKVYIWAVWRQQDDGSRSDIKDCTLLFKNHLTDEDVYVSIDGAHVKIGSTCHFDIQLFLKQNGCIYVSEDLERWQGEYKVMGSEHNLIISSTPGVGDVKVHLEEGKELLIEAKKGKTNKSGQEYVLMREAIGQLMTSDKWTKSTIPVVAVPYSEKELRTSRKVE